MYLPARKTHFSDYTLPLDLHRSLYHRFQVFKDQSPNPGAWTPSALIMLKKKPRGGFAVELTAQEWGIFTELYPHIPARWKMWDYFHSCRSMDFLQNRLFNAESGNSIRLILSLRLRCQYKQHRRITPWIGAMRRRCETTAKI